jgi:diadenosine tetraphosphatase ApaH/serine/threonine PP2A family protein phosphatase
MRIAIISDIHANVEALRKVMERITLLEPDRIYCLGDIVGYGPHPNECIEMIRKDCHGIVAGNHDVAVAGDTSLERFDGPGRKAIRWTREKISDANRRFLAGLPLRIVEDDITYVHSSPADEASWIHLSSWTELERAFGAFTTRLCFVGHSHVPFIAGEDGSVGNFDASTRMIINVGSVGQPRSGSPDAVFGFLDTTKWTYEINDVPYNVEAAAEAVRKASLPSVLARRLLVGY